MSGVVQVEQSVPRLLFFAVRNVLRTRIRRLGLVPVRADARQQPGDRLLHLGLTVLLSIGTGWAQGFPPAEAVKRMTVAPGFDVRLVASEPMLAQPVCIEFDARGRIWVVQYLQYPNPAGLKRVKVDRYFRTVYDQVPAPPPHGPRGADRVTILEDTDGDGVADRARDFVDGLNLATSIAFGHGGVFVMQAPYLLFYPDRDGDDVPDTAPEVLLSGFGIEDAQSFANSLIFGPDGWLYGCQGSTVTAKVRGQLAATAARLRPETGLAVAQRVALQDRDAADPFLPLQLWWAVERHAVSGLARAVELFATPVAWRSHLARQSLLPRLVRRYGAEGSADALRAGATLLASQPVGTDRAVLRQALEQGLRQRAATRRLGLDVLPPALVQQVLADWNPETTDEALLRLLVWLGHGPARARTPRSTCSCAGTGARSTTRRRTSSPSCAASTTT